jgi:hypothetical protein
MAENRFTQRFAVAQVVNDNDDDRSYEPFQTVQGQRRAPRFEIVTETGELYAFAYSYLGEWVYNPRGFLTFSTSGSIVTVEGEGLDQLHQLLREEKLVSLYVFRNGFHNEPADGKAKIKKVEVRGRFDPSNEP